MMKTRKKLNVRFIACLLALLTVFGVGVHFAHAFQMKRNARALLQQADKAREAKREAQKAKEDAWKAKDEKLEVESAALEVEHADKEFHYLSLYLGFVKDDAESLARYGVLLDERAKRIKSPNQSIRERTRALAALEQALLSNPKISDIPEIGNIRRRLVDIAMGLRKFNDALAHLKILEKTAPQDAELKQLLGLCEENRGNHKEAIEAYKKAVELAPTRLENYKHLAVLYHKQLDKPSDAEKIMQEMVKNNEKNFQARLDLARYYITFDAGKPALEEAKKAVREAKALAPKEPDVVLVDADVARLQGQADEARKILNHGIAVHLQDRRMYLALINLEIREAKPDAKFAEVFKVIDKGLRELPEDSDLLYARASLLVQIGKSKESKELEKAKGIIDDLRKKKFAPLRLTFLDAYILFQKDEWAKAEEVLEGVQRELKTQPDFYLLLGQCHERLGNPDKALLAFEEAKKLEPNSVQARLHRASALMTLGRTNEGLIELRSIKMSSEAPQSIHLLLARTLIAQNLRLPLKERRLNEINRELELAKTKEPNSLEVPILKAETILLGDPTQVENARRVLEDARNAHPDEVNLWIALARLAGREGKVQDALNILDNAEQQENLKNRIELRLVKLGFLTGLSKEEVRTNLKKMEKDLDELKGEDRLRLMAGMADTFLRINAPEDAEQFMNKIAKERPANLGIRLLLFDLAVTDGKKKPADREKEVARILTGIKRIEGTGAYWHYGEASHLVMQARPKNEKEKLGENGRKLLGQAREHLKKASELRPSWFRVPALEAEIEMLGAREAEIEMLEAKKLGEEDKIKALEAEAKAAIDKHQKLAIEKYQKALEMGDRRPEVIRDLVQLLYSSGRIDEANQAVTKLLDQEQTLLSAGLGKLATERLLSNPDQTKRDPQRVLEITRNAVPPDSKSYQDQLWLGRVLWALGKQDEKNQKDRFKEAENALRKARELNDKAPETLVTLVSFLADTGKSKGAKQVLEEARKKESLPKDQASLALAVCYEIIGDQRQAEDHWKAALAAKPKDVVILRNVASFYIRNSRPAEAVPHLWVILEQKEPLDEMLWARRRLALSLVAKSILLKDFEEARRLIEKNLNEGENKTKLEDWHVMARLLATRLNYRKEAIKWFKELSEKGSLSAEERFKLVQLYLGEQNWTEAQLHLQILVGSPEGKQPQYLTYYIRRLLEHNQLGAAKLQLDNLKAVLRPGAPGASFAIESEVRILRAEGEDEKALNLLKTYAQSKDADLGQVALLMETLGPKAKNENLYRKEAEAMYRRNVDQSKKPERFLLLAEFLGRQHDVDDALNYCEKALREKVAPETVAPIMIAILRECEAGERHCQQVETHLKEALNGNPKSIPLLLSLADLQDYQQRFPEAEALYRNVIENDKTNIMALNNLAWLWAFKEGMGPDALNTINRAIEEVGEAPELLDTRAVINMKLGKGNNAIADLQNAIAMAPSLSRSFHLAQAWVLAGDGKKAAEELTKARKGGLKREQLHPKEQPTYTRMLEALKGP